MNILRFSALVSCVCASAGTARAHQSSVLYSDIVVHGRDVTYSFQVASTDLFEPLGVDANDAVTRETVRARYDGLTSYLSGRVVVTSKTSSGDAPGVGALSSLGEAPCPAVPTGLRFLDSAAGAGAFFAVVTLEFRCPNVVTDATVTYNLFFDLDPRHQGIARVRFGDDEGHEQVFRNDSRTLSLSRPLTTWDHAADYLVLGIEHIFTGYDHLAFLIGLLIIVGASGLYAGAKKVVTVVTAFTLAHSVTLIASAMGWVAVPSSVVEPAIALSIAYIGIENLRSKAPRYRWLVTFIFGLIHGFGFASVLKDIGLPREGLVLSLLSFNAGVELGQLCVVAAVLPLLALLSAASRHTHGPWFRRQRQWVGVGALCVSMFLLFQSVGVSPVQLGVLCFVIVPGGAFLGWQHGYDVVVRRGGSVVIAVLGAFWFAERVLARSWLGGWLG